MREVTDREQEATWRLHLFGDFMLIAPDGTPRQLHNRKCEGLIGLLAANQPYGIRREAAGAALWPDKALEKQQESLRQVLAIIRRLLGEDFINATRTECRFSSRIKLECDLDRPDLRKGPVFMPVQDGEWVENIRTLEDCDLPEASRDSVMSHYLESLRWCARFDPKSFFALFHANRSLARGLATSDIIGLLDIAGRPDGFSGWPDYWRGIAEEDLDVSSRLLRNALRAAVGAKDWDLASDVCFELGKTYSRRGKVTAANRTAKAAYEVADRANTKAARINAARLKGTLLLHWGETRAGLELLEMSAELVEDPIRRAVVETTQAWFAAMSGSYPSAARWLERGEELYKETGHQQVYLLSSATRAILSIHEGSRTNAIPGLEQMARESHDGGSCQFGVYAEESLAKLYRLDHDRELAAAKLNSARQTRLKTRMARTPLETAMVAAIR